MKKPPAGGRSLARRWPWAFALALCGLLVVEAMLELSIRGGDYPTRDHLRNTGAFRHVLRHHGAAEVAIVGASVARRSVVIPEMRDGVSDALGFAPSIVNYAHQGARAEFVEDQIHVLLRQDPAPEIILYGVTPAQLASDNVPQKTSYVWGAADLSRELSVEPLRTLGEIPQVIRNEIKLRSRILQLRYDLWGWRDYLVFGKAFPPGAMVGEQHHRGRFGSSSLTDHPDPAHGSLYEELVRNAADTTVDGRWVPSPVRIQAMDAMLAACQARGVALIAYEVPVPTVYRALLPPNTYSDFYAEMDALEIPFVPLSDLGVTHTDAHFSDVVHMNLEGARLLSGPMVREVLVPAIERRAAEQ